MDLKTSNTHLEEARLVADTLDAWEQAHIDSCVRCRSERRLRKTPDTAPAQRIGPYVVLGEIGSGGMGRVYAVWHPERGEKRAIKVLTLESRSARERFLREARAQQRVVHENVLPVLEVLALSDGPALVLPLVRGPSLAVLLAQYEPTQAESLALFRGLCAGVAAIHEAHLVHRDLKPSNVLLDASGDALQVRVADFGLVKVLAESTDEMLTRSGVQLGTPAYMAPEQRIDPKRIDARRCLVARRHPLRDALWPGPERSQAAADPGDRAVGCAGEGDARRRSVRTPC